MKETDLAWAAGFIDGEGHILIRRFKSGDKYKYHLGLQISQLVRLPLDKMVSILGGTIHLHASSGRHYYRYRLWSREALNALILVRPYLSLKKAEADLVIDRFYPLIGGVGKRIPEETRLEMGILWQEIRDMRLEAKANA